ncbi:uncharacterized protein [Palaemon carinicauda]|uniref:uncharacterized protein n=1 Tax=Palaemon carinicauda TaxID=392227 RepID=UPI0035B6A96C
MVNGLPQGVFQDHMVHHPLLQYQMLFPSLLLSIAKPPTDDDDGINDYDGKVNPMDHLRFSALANQLAITQINQVLMDLVKDTPGDDIKKLKESQGTFMELIRDGFALLNQEITRSKSIFINNSKLLSEQDKKLETLEDVAAKGFIENLSKVVNLQNSLTDLSNKTSLNNKDFQRTLASIDDSIAKVHYAIGNITDDKLCCYKTGLPPVLEGVLPTTEAPLLSHTILTDIQGELQNLSKALIEFIDVTRSREIDRDTMKVLIEKCSNASIGETDIDFSNITSVIEEAFAKNKEFIHPKVVKISEDLNITNDGLLEAKTNLQQIKEILTTKPSQDEAGLQDLTTLTLLGFANLTAKIENLFNQSQARLKEETKCPAKYFAVNGECFFVTVESQVTYKNSSELCDSLGSILAEPKSILKFLSFMETFEYNKTVDLWMGGRKRSMTTSLSKEVKATVALWQWQTRKSDIDHGWNYECPSNNGDCLMLKENGLQDSDCEDEKGFVCQYPPLL